MMSSASPIDQLLKQGIAAARAGHQDEARQRLLRVVELDDQNELAWLWLSGVVESDADRRVCLDNVLTINPTNAAAQKGLRLLNARVPQSQGEPAQHEPAQHEPAQRERAQRERCPHCGAELPATGNFCAACHQPVLIACPNCQEYVEITALYCRQCDMMLGDYHDHNPYYLGLADAYLQHNHYPLAQWSLEQVAQGVPDAEALLGMADLYLRLNKPDRAIDLYRQAGERDPQNVTPYLKLADLYRQQDQREEMQEVYRAALRRWPEQPEVLLAWATALAERRGSAAEAIDLLKRALKQQPDNAAMHLLLARLYTRIDDSTSAASHYRQVKTLAEPGSAEASAAQNELSRLRQADPEGWGEFTRHALGLMLCPICAALANAQLSPLKIDLLSWLLLIFAFGFSVLWISSSDMPRNPITLKLFGAHELPQLQTPLLSIAAKVLWVLTFALIVVRA